MRLNRVRIKNKNRILQIGLIIVLLALEIAIVISFAPEYILRMWVFELPILLVFLMNFWLICYLAFALLLKNRTNGILISSFIVILLVFKINKLTNPIFTLLLAAIFLMITIFLIDKKGLKK